MNENVVPPYESMHRMMTVNEVAAILNVSVRHVWRMRSAFQIPPPIRLGSVVRWSRDVIERWIADGCPAKSCRDNG